MYLWEKTPGMGIHSCTEGSGPTKGRAPRRGAYAGGGGFKHENYGYKNHLYKPQYFLGQHRGGLLQLL